MAARTERKTGVDAERRPALRVVVLVPARHDHELLADGKRREVFFPVVAPILLGAAEQLDLVGDALGFIALAEERDRLGRRDVRLEVDVDKRPRAILCEQILVDEVDVRDVLDNLLEVGVVLDIYAAGHDDVGDIACPVNIRGIDRNLDFSPLLHICTLLIRKRSL